MTKEQGARHAQSVQHAIDQHARRPGGLLPLLHEIQEELGHVPAEAIAAIASAMNLSRAEVQGVVSFYPDFRRTPPGRHVLKLCRAEACKAMGADALAEQIQRRFAVSFNHTTADGTLTLEPVYCLGNCACAPAAMLDGDVHGRVTAEGVDRLLQGERA